MPRRRPLAILAMLSAALAVCGVAFADDVIGQASVIDGDTIEIHGARIRIFGIDAPESDQLCRNSDSEHYRCGQKASNALLDFIARRPVECVEVDRDRYNRTVAVCSVGLGVLTSPIGLSETGWRSTGPGIAKATTPRRRPKQSASSAACGAAASGSRGIIGLAGGQVEDRKDVRTIEACWTSISLRMWIADDEIIGWLERREQRTRDRHIRFQA
jgi:Staphylococcal nuclease homologue